MFCTSFALGPLPDMPNKNCEPKQIFRQHPGSGRCGQLEVLRGAAGKEQESQSQRQLKAQKKKRKKGNKENFSFVALLKFSCAASMAITAGTRLTFPLRGGEGRIAVQFFFFFWVRGCRPIWQTMCVIVVISSSSWPSPINSANKCAFKCHLPRPTPSSVARGRAVRHSEDLCSAVRL